MERLLEISPAIVAIVIFLYLKNDHNNRRAERHNRLVDRQEKLMSLIKEKTEKNEQSTDNISSGKDND